MCLGRYTAIWFLKSSVKIGEAERELGTVTREWVLNQVDRRRAQGIAVCMRVSIRQGSINMVLSTPSCPTAPTQRKPNEQERKILDRWDRMGLSEEDPTGQDVIEFLNGLNL
jgi:hypothetical protein